LPLACGLAVVIALLGGLERDGAGVLAARRCHRAVAGLDGSVAASLHGDAGPLVRDRRPSCLPFARGLSRGPTSSRRLDASKPPRRPRAGAARVLRRMLDWPFERIIVAHGSPIEHDAREVFRVAFSPYM